MSLKTKLTSLITTFVLLCSLLTVGVFAVKNTTFNVGGDIVFNVQGIEATIALSNTGLTNIVLPEGVTAGNQVFAPITIDNTTTAESIASQFAKWSNLDLTFAQGQSTASIELVITNTSSDDNNYIDITALADAITKENAKIKVSKTGGGIVGLVAKGKSETFTITFSVIDDEYKASLNDFNVAFEMKKLTPDEVPTFDADERLTIQCDTENNQASIVYSEFSEETESLELPRFVKSGDVVCLVDTIGSYGIDSDTMNLKSVIIPNSISTIENEAFCGAGLVSIVIPDTVVNLDTYMLFSCCENLENVVLPEGIEEIGYCMFDQCRKLPSINIPSTVKLIDEEAFSNCKALTNIKLPYSLEKIENRAFSSCTGLTSITIPERVESIGDDAFSGCSNLTNIVVESGNNVYDSRNNCNAIIETASNTLIVGCKNTVIPNGVENIADYAFVGGDPQNLVIPESVKNIGNLSFNGKTEILTIDSQEVVTKHITEVEAEFGNTGMLWGVTTINIRADLTPTSYLTSLGTPTDVEINGVAYKQYTRNV